MAKQSDSITEQLGLDRLRDEVSDLGRALTQKGLEKITSLADVSGAADSVKGTVKDGIKDTVKGGIKDKVKDVIPGMSSDSSNGGKGNGKGNKVKVTTIIESVDVPVPRTVAYQQWTQFQEFPSFMKKVENVEQKSDEKLKWQAQIFWSHRTWDATITEQVPDERIVWRSSGEKGHVDGAVTFHELAPDLTRVLAVLEYHPKGLFEKTGNIWRAQGRRARVELKHFQRHVATHTLIHQEEVDGWEGEIHDSKVVKKTGRGSGGRSPAKKTAAKKSTSSSSSARSSSTAKKAPAKKSAAKKAPAKKTAAKKAPAKKSAAKKAPAKKTAAAQRSTARRTTSSSSRTTTRKAPAKKTAASRNRRSTAKKTASSRS